MSVAGESPAPRPRGRAAVVVIAAEVAVGALVAALLLGGGAARPNAQAVLAGEPTTPADAPVPGADTRTRVDEVERLVHAAGIANFATLAGARGQVCARADRLGAFDCSWLDAQGQERGGRFVVRDGALARVSDGGLGPAPRTAAEATAIVAAVLARRRVRAAARCTRFDARRYLGRLLPLPPGTYDCVLAAGAAHGTLRWSWNADGTVARETFGPAHPAARPRAR